MRLLKNIFKALTFIDLLVAMMCFHYARHSAWAGTMNPANQRTGVENALKVLCALPVFVLGFGVFTVLEQRRRKAS